MASDNDEDVNRRDIATVVLTRSVLNAVLESVLLVADGIRYSPAMFPADRDGQRYLRVLAPGNRQLVGNEFDPDAW